MFNVDDSATLYVNGSLVGTVGYQGDQKFDVSKRMQAGTNSLQFRLTNAVSGYTYGFRVFINDNLFFEDICGTAGVVGCNNNDDRTGVVYDNKVLVEFDAPPTASSTQTPTPTLTQTPTATSTQTPTATSSPQPPTATRTPDAPSATSLGLRTSTPSHTPTRTATPVIEEGNGDVNCDGRSGSVDAALILQYRSGLVQSLTCRHGADVNGDGRIDVIDAALILQHVAGFLQRLPVIFD